MKLLACILLAGALHADPAQVVQRYYIRHCLDHHGGLVLQAGRDTQEAAAKLGIIDHVPTLLAMWHVESGFTSGILSDDGRSYGIAQTIRRRAKHWRHFWRKRGVYLGVIEDPTTQVYFGVAEYWECLKGAHGNVREAVRRYNGSGWRAERHVKRVMRARTEIFGPQLLRKP